MARGWESKSIEDQISAKEADSRDRKKQISSPEELQRQSKRDSLLLARTRTVSALETAKDEGYRTILKRALAHLDSQLAQLP
jgi:hypothetical protein